MKIAIINGPNLNLVGRREPHLYGNVTMDDYLHDLTAQYPQVQFSLFQSNHEGSIIDELQRVGFDFDGIVLNAGGYSHTSIAIADALRAITAPVVEVHITDIYSREPFRRVSMIADACVKSIVGHGLDGYRMAVDHLIAYHES
ncbi:MAG: 3-dehydroquinate dehydratase [Muribaculaceae bacterium]|nr:3-dehydroquinate dehydratase [Muribaculaceae bacterium]